MNPKLNDLILALDPAEPWVWKLKLSETDFIELESMLIDSIREQGSHAHLLTAEWAKHVIVYMAEWYKRRYKKGNQNDALNLDSSELEAVWKASGLSVKRLVYRDGAGNRRWQYSIYVLGGLAIRHELGRNDKGRFMKAICRIYHRENYTLENLDDEARAISFRESISRQHSLYYYLQEILNGHLPFCESDLTDANSEVNRFVFAMKSANDEIMRQKFRLEWIVTNIPQNPVMGRALRLWLKPEEVGEGMNQYLRFDRVLLWGIKEPERNGSLKVGIQFLCGEKIILPIDWEHPLITFLISDAGFLAVGVDDYAVCKALPVRRFDKLQIVVKEESGLEHIVQEEVCRDYLQLWRISPADYRWSSVRSSQHETAVVYSAPWTIVLDSTSEVVENKPFKEKTLGLSDTWHWYYIYDTATIVNGRGGSITFYNRQGYDRVATKLYSNTIRYINGGYVNYCSEDEYGDISPRLLPLIFNPHDVIVRHFNTKDDILNAQPDSLTEPELIEFKDGANYVEWTDIQTPGYGYVKLRVTIKGTQEPFEVCYLPSFDNEIPVKRDFANQCVRYRSFGEDGISEEKTYQDHIEQDYTPLEPVVSLKCGHESVFVELDVWRPTLQKEIMKEGKILKYLSDGEYFTLPYIHKDKVVINDFSREGYRSYACSSLGNIYTSEFMDIDKNPTVGMAALAFWYKGGFKEAKYLDALAPEYLVIVMGNSRSDVPSEDVPLVFWNYDESQDLELVSAEYAGLGNWGILFQDLKETKDLSCYYPMMNDDDPWEWDQDATSNLKCFMVANECGIYFFEMMPLRELSKQQYVEEIYKPLFDLREGKLNEKDILGLRRFSEEFGFDWLDLGIIIDNE